MDSKQISIIIGSLLGDGCLSGLKKHPTWNWKFTKKQSCLDKEGCDKFSYVNYHLLSLQNSVIGHIYNYIEKEKVIANNKHYSPASPYYYYVTRTLPLFTELGKKWYRLVHGVKTKIIPSDLVLDPLSLCIWFMDDGNKEKGQNRYRIATNCFSHADVGDLASLIRKNFQIKAQKIENSLGQPMLEIGGYQQCKKFYDTILPLVRWDCFSYKLESPKEIIALSGEKHPLAKLSLSDIKYIIKKYNNGETQTALAKKFGVKCNTISSIISGASWKKLDFDLSQVQVANQGERNPKAKLTEHQVQEIKLLKGIMSYKEISKKYSVSKALISHIMNGRCWTSINSHCKLFAART